MPTTNQLASPARATSHRRRTHHRALARCALLALALLGWPQAHSHAAPPRSTYLPLVTVPPSGSVQQALFYDQGRSTPAEIAGRAGLVILPRGKSRLREELRRAGYRGPALQYFLANEVAGPGPYANASAACDRSFQPYVENHVAFEAGDFCTLIHPNESWFVHNGKGERLIKRHHDGYAYQMNPASPGWRGFALQRMARDLLGDGAHPALGWDGIFLDNLHLKVYSLRHQKQNSDGVVQEFAGDAQYRAAVEGYLAQLSATLRPRSRLWANLTDDWDVGVTEQMGYLQYLDGSMNEAWAVGYPQYPLNAERWDRVLTIAETALASGKGLLAVVQGAQSDQTRQTFGLASYLLIVNGGPAYFRYADAAQYGSWWQYPNYSVALGEPLGRRQRVGEIWRREFRCGYVEVDPAARNGRIVPTSCRAAGAIQR